jgi:putative transposase
MAPKKITIDKSRASAAVIESYISENEAEIEIRQNKFLNNIANRITEPLNEWRGQC